MSGQRRRCVFLGRLERYFEFLELRRRAESLFLRNLLAAETAEVPRIELDELLLVGLPRALGYQFVIERPNQR